MSLDPESASERWHLGRKLTLLILLVTALALGLVILSRQKADFPRLIFNLFAVVSIGLVAGLAARWVLRGRNWFIRGLASAALVIIGLVVLGYFSGGASGLALPPLRFASAVHVHIFSLSVKLPLPESRTAVDWLGLVYLVIAVDVSWIALRAWGRPVVHAAEAAAPAARRSAGPRLLPSLNLPRIRARSSSAQPRLRSRKSGRPLISSAAPAPVKAAGSRRWNPLHHKPQIQLAVYEEHRCPYCLEEVKRNDPRGVVECEICHTLHHKDCWAITGACQVPHLNT